MERGNESVPVVVGEHLSSTITGLGAKGDAIIRKGNYVIMVKELGLQVGDHVDVVVTKVLPNYAFAERRA